MDSLRLQNLRCLSDTGFIDIKPITVLLGQNSSGKSTFLRTFPLLRQSVESRTVGPILWNGRLVDFGNYEDARQKKSNQGIVFSFKFKLKADKMPYYPINIPELLIYKRYFKYNILHELDVSLELELSEDSKKEKTIIKKLILQLADSKIQVTTQDNGNISEFYINSLNVLDLGYGYALKKLSNQDFLSTIIESREEVNKVSDTFDFNGLSRELIQETKKIAHQNTSIEKIMMIISPIKIGQSKDMLKDIQDNKFATKSWKNRTEDWTIESKEFQKIRDLIIANSIPDILEKCDTFLSNFFRRISYMGPVRATAERYYRTQDLAVDEVDYQGRNLAMFLRNLTDSERKKFREWTQKNLGFSLSIKPSLGLISLEISPQNSKQSFNVTDTGFGFSQILPIITQLWLLTEFPKSTNKARERLRSMEQSPLLFAIEQPELHLHPHLQGKLTDVFVNSIKAARGKDIDLRIILETHSEVLVNRLGHLIAEGKISPDDINIVLFEPSDKLGEIKVRTVHFDSEGYLSDWPLGFFDMDLD